MGINFQIEIVFDKITRKSPHLIAKLLDTDKNFQLSDITTLGGFKVKRFTMPRSLDSKGELRLDLFVFELSNKSDVINFKKGQIVVLLNG